jgi:hypothetical protein
MSTSILLVEGRAIDWLVKGMSPGSRKQYTNPSKIVRLESIKGMHNNYIIVVESKPINCGYDDNQEGIMSWMGSDELIFRRRSEFILSSYYCVGQT